MRKLLALLISATLMLSLVACGDSGNTDETNGQNQDVSQGVETETNDNVQAEDIGDEINDSDALVFFLKDAESYGFADGDKETKLIISDGYMTFNLLGEWYEFSSDITNPAQSFTKNFRQGDVDIAIKSTTDGISVELAGNANEYRLFLNEDSYNLYMQENSPITNLDNDMFLIEDGVLVRYRGTDTDVEIPNGVTTIGEQAFWEASITSVSIPDSVTIIEEDAFYGCENLASIDLHEGITKIGMRAFSYCSSLTSVAIPSTVKTIGTEAFSGCENLASIDLSEGITEIGYGSFSFNNALTTVTIPGSIKIIADNSFFSCDSLTTVVIEEGVTEIAVNAFAYSPSLTSVTIPSTITTIGDLAFYDCPNLQLEIPSTVTSVGENVFG